MAQTPSSSSLTHTYTYDVFLSFRGEDTRFGFTGNLFDKLCQSGIRTFFDDRELEGGDSIKPSLVNAIENSRTAIIVFSKNYASSSFCLDELVNIIRSIQDKGRRVFPVFYDVDPSDVRHQRGSYKEALAVHEERFKTEKLLNWRNALSQAADLAGYHFKLGGGYEYEFIERIIKDVSNKINHAPLHVADCPVGMDSRVLKVMELLDISSDRVHMVGIHGMGGIGKTTLAWAVYDSIAVHFDSVCFLEDVRENSNKHGLKYLLEMLLYKLTGKKDITFTTVKEGVSEIIKRLHKKKVLLILDDVNAPKQLHDMVGGLNWFGLGSRVIITTRDKHLLERHGVERTYEVEELNEKDAFELLRWKAFKNKKVYPGYEDMLNRAVTYASGLPLALEVIGSNLFGKSIEEWKFALDRYERIPNKEIQKILKVSFDSLEEDEQSVFLDIACCFNGYRLVEVDDILHSHYGNCMTYHIRVLVEKSLMKICSSGWVMLHDLIGDMGKEIVRQESPKEPGKHSRLWFHEDIVQVLEDNLGTSNIEMIYLHFPNFKEEVNWDGKAFKKMTFLKTLIIKNGHFSEGPKQLPNSLRVLEWKGFPSQSLPSNFHPTRLAILRLPRSSVMSLELAKLPKKFVNLRDLSFKRCKFIKEIPDVSGVPNLEKISLESCENLIKIHESVGFLDKLRILNAYGCHKLRSFPPRIKLTSLEELELSHCKSLESFPEVLGEMEKITELFLYGSVIKKLPCSIRNLTRLQKLEISDCATVQIELSSSIFMLPELEELHVGRCEGLQLSEQDDSEGKLISKGKLRLSGCMMSDEFLQIGLTWFSNVIKLDLSYNNFTILPACIKECHFLRKLNLNGCRLLQEIRGIPPNIVVFYASYCTSLKELDLTLLPACTKQCCFLRELYLDDCNNLQEIKGIPSSLEFLSARNCTSLTSQCGSMLMNKDLHEAGGKEFWLPATNIPEWFEHQSRGLPISFWFRNKFPAISLFLVTEFGPLKVIVNRKKYTPFISPRNSVPSYRNDHIVICDLKQIVFDDIEDEVRLENEWNHLELSIDIDLKFGRKPMNHSNIQIGLHVVKEKCSMEDIRFKDPYISMLIGEKHRLDTVVSQMQTSSTTSVRDADSSRKFVGPLIKTQEPLVSNMYVNLDRELMLLKIGKGKLDENINLAPKSSTIAPIEAETSFLSLLRDTLQFVFCYNGSEETQEALPPLLQPELPALMKDTLEYLLSLPTYRVSHRKKIEILELSEIFAQLSLEYKNARLKRELTAAVLSKAKKVKKDIEANVKDLGEVETLENYFNNRLACLQERNGELVEQIKDIKAEIAYLTQDTDAIGSNKSLPKAESDDLSNQVTRLEVELDWAEETQANIEADWFDFGQYVIHMIMFQSESESECECESESEC